MAHSTIAATKKTLVTRLRARPGLAGVQVGYRWPDEPENEVLALGKTIGDHTIAVERAGRKKRDERYAIELWVSVTGSDESACDDRAAVIAGEVEDELADDPKLGGTVPGLLWAVLSKYELNTQADPDAGTESVIELGVTCFARLD